MKKRLEQVLGKRLAKADRYLKRLYDKKCDIQAAAFMKLAMQAVDTGDWSAVDAEYAWAEFDLVDRA